MIVGVGLLFCTAFIILEILLRQFGASLKGTEEIAGYVMALVTSWGMAYCLLELGHVRIDLIRARLNDRKRAMLDLFSLSTVALVATLIGIKCWPVVERSLTNDSRANTHLETPLALVQLPWFLGWCWFAVSAWITLVATTVLVLNANYNTAECTIGIKAEVKPTNGTSKSM